MISARRAALLGLTTPLSAIMLAVLGLWPESEDAPIEIPVRTAADPRGGGNAASKKKAKDDDDHFLAWKRRMKEQAQAMIAAVCAIAEEAYA